MVRVSLISGIPDMHLHFVTPCYAEEKCCGVDGEIRLIDNGTNNASGRVEVCLDGHWGTVCDDGWDSNDATTVCRQLGYNETGNSQMPPFFRWICGCLYESYRDL